MPPAMLEVVAGEEPSVPKAPHLAENRQERDTFGGQFVLDAWGRLGEASAQDHTLLLEGVQTL
jgi:hypothetical protein